MTTTQPWEIEFDKRADPMESDSDFIAGCYECGESINRDAIKSFITSTRLSAYKEGQRDMREEVVKMAEGKVRETYYMRTQKQAEVDDTYNRALTDLISEITK